MYVCIYMYVCMYVCMYSPFTKLRPNSPVSRENTCGEWN